MLRFFSRGLLMAALAGFGSASIAQTLVEIPLDLQTLDAPVISTSSQSSLADCTVGQQLVQDAVTAAFGAGNAVGDPPAPQELGQSFTAPCRGTLQTIQVALQNGAGQEPAQEVSITLLVFEGAGTNSLPLSSTDSTFNLPPAGFFGRYDLDVTDDVQLVEGSVYTFFVDETDGPPFGIHADQDASYAGGALFVSNSGNSTGAVAEESLDLRFTATFGPPMATAGETFEERGFSLSTARPNPATGTSRFDLAVATPQDVRVAVYDALGRQVAVLLDGAVAGTETVTLDAARLAPGIYVVRAVGATFATTQTITVVR